MSTTLSSEEIKKITGIQAAQLIQPNTIVGIGTGTTAHWVIIELGKRIQQGLSIKAVPTSQQTKTLAQEQGIPLLELNDVATINLTIDGADEIDPHLQLIKGGGGALLQEKMVAAASQQLVIVADHTKLVKQLGAFPLPVEVIPYGWKQVLRRIRQSHTIEVSPRTKNNKPFVTDHGHYVLDCHFLEIPDASKLHSALKKIPGVVETGLFINMASSAVVGYPDGTVKTISSSKG